MTDPLPVILDVDTGIDDALALLLACASPEIDLVAVTCVAGNVPLDQVVANTRAVLTLGGRADVPVIAGAARPIVKDLETTEETHGPRGIGYAELPGTGAAGLPGDAGLPGGAGPVDAAAAAIADLARRRPGELQLVTLGPMTNLALALGLEPRLPALLRDWTLMGGAYRVSGNTTPVCEWNLYVDPDAARTCLAAWAAAIVADPGLPLPLAMGLDVTESARLLPAHVRRIADLAGAAPEDSGALEDPDAPMRPAGTVAANPVLRYVVDSLRFYFEFHARYDRFYGAFVHDPFALAATVDRALVTTRPAFVDVETGPGPAHGMTIADWRGLLDRPANMAVAVTADPEAFLDRLVTRLGTLAAATAGG